MYRVIICTECLSNIEIDNKHLAIKILLRVFARLPRPCWVLCPISVIVMMGNTLKTCDYVNICPKYSETY